MNLNEYYIAGGTLRGDAPCYVARMADHGLFDKLLSGEFCYVLTPRQMGKSSLMVRTAQRLKDAGVTVAVLDLTAAGQNLSVEQWYGGLLSQMGQQLDLEDELIDFWRDRALLGPLQRWMAAIRDQVLPKIRERLIIFIDEIDAVRSLSFNTDEFFAGIREFYNRRTVNPELNLLNFCLLGVATPADLIRNTVITPFNIGHRIELLDFTEAEALQLARGLKRDEDLNRRLLRRVFYWTNGHPYLTQRLCQRISSDASIAREADVDVACEELFLSPHARERDDNLLFVRERLLRSDVDLAELLNQYSRVLGQNLLKAPVRDDENSPFCSILRLSGITRPEREGLTVRNRIYSRVFDQKWVRDSMPDGELRRQRNAYWRGVLKAASYLAVVVAIVSGLGIYSWQQRNLAIEEERNASRLLYAANMNLAAQAWETANIMGLKVLLSGSPLDRSSGYKRGFEWNYYNNLLHGEVARFEHEDYALSARFSPDGRMLATAGKDRLIRIWDLATRMLHTTIAGHDDQIWRIAYSPDGSRLASAGWDRRIKIWDTRNGRELLTLAGHKDRVCGVDFSPDGKTLASSGWDGRVILWNAGTGQQIRTLTGHESWVWSVIFSPDGGRLISTGEDQTVRIWDVAKGIEIRKLEGHRKSVYTAVFSADGKHLFTGSSGGEIFRWETANFTRTGSLKSHTNPVNSLSISRDGKYLASAGVDRIIRIWDTSSLEIVDMIRGHADEIRSIEFSRSDALLATAGDDNGVNLWDTSETGSRDVLLHDRDLITATRLTKNGRTLAVADDSAIIFWNLQTKRQTGQIETDFQINDLAFSPDETIIAAALRDNTVGLWDIRTRTLICKLTGNIEWVFSVKFSPDGRTIATGDRTHLATLWDIASRNRLATFTAHESGVKSVAFSPDGKFLATAGDDRMIYIWELATGRQFTSLTGHKNEVWTIKFSPDGKWLASAGYDRSIKIWDWKLGVDRSTLLGHSAGVKVIAYSPDGSRLASGSEDGMIKLWDPENGLELTTLARQSSSITDLEFSSGNDLLVSGGKERKVYLWRASAQR